MKLKHPDYFSKIGLNQIYNLKDLEDLKSVTSDGKPDSESDDHKVINEKPENPTNNILSSLNGRSNQEKTNNEPAEPAEKQVNTNENESKEKKKPKE